ncbi:unnamed protein product [Pieris macdunnoughi]|uniref:Uncharacterized protein n=1 Tax=Pieris macdunnoughi TaxID=345717 RepID=A0A821NUT8_9NEOP|nr:unnamed protein product [Pieris macdunnoughi]
MSKILILKVFPQKCWLRKIVWQYIPFAKYSDSCGGDSKEPPKDQSSSPGASSPSIYDTRKYGHKLPRDSVRPTFEPLSGVPTGVFRCTDGEVCTISNCTNHDNMLYFVKGQNEM